MRIVVNDIAASSGGAMAILTSFYNYIRENDKDNTWIFLVSNDCLQETERIKIVKREDVKKNWIRKLKFDFLDGARYIDSFSPDYVISLQNVLTFGVKAAQAVYVHQAIPFQNNKKFSFFEEEERVYAFYQYFVGFLIKRSVKAANQVFVQTKWMKRNVAWKAAVSDEKITVIPIECESFDISQEFDEGSTSHSFFYPAAFESCYKNQKCIYDACELLRNEGRTDYQIALTLEESSYKANEIVCCGRLNKSEMLAHYQKSTLVFPSYLETVGLPLVEAMSVGAVVLAADCEYAHEVLDSYENAYFFNPFKPDELKNRMMDVMDGRIKKKSINRYTREEEDGWGILLSRIQEVKQ